MRRFALVASAIALLGASPSPAPTATPSLVKVSQSCDDDTIRAVSTGGAIVRMMSGAIYEVDQVDRIYSSLWLPATDALVCVERLLYNGKPVALYTIRVDSDKASAQKLR